MDSNLIIYSLILLVSVFISSVSQVLLKKSANKSYKNIIKEYLNPLVIIAYFIFFVSTFITIFAYKYVPLSLGPILETTSYIYITIFSITLFKERVSLKKILSLSVIVIGIVVFTVF